MIRLPTFSDNARTFVPKHHRHRSRQLRFHHRHVGMAKTRRNDTHEDFIVSRLFQIELFEGQGGMVVTGNGRCYFHDMHWEVG